MDLQLADKAGYQIKEIKNCTLDIDLNGEKDFELSMSVADYDNEITMDSRIFVLGTEIGGIIGEKTSDSSIDSITYTGDTWRGRLAKKIILPPDGQDYYIATGELNMVLKKLIEPKFGELFKVSRESTGVEVSYQFERFCTLYDGIVKMLKSVGYRLDLTYNEGVPNSYGWVDVQAVPIKDYSEEIELSQDSQLSFVVQEKCDGINHLIIGGKGELQERNVLHLYVQKDGTIGKTQYYYGLNEIAEFYENTSTETDELEKAGIERLQERMNSKTFTMDVESLDININIGDIIGGRDQITGLCLAKPLKNVIVTIKNGDVSKEYRLED